MRKIGTFLLTFSIVFYPIIELIKVGTINLGDIFMLFSVIILIPFIDINICERHLKPILLYSIIHFIFFGYLQYDLITSFFHYIFFLIIIIWYVPNFIEKDTLYYFFRFMILINGCIIIAQYILMKGFDFYLFGERSLFANGNVAYFDSLHPRPFGIFSEPSSFAFSGVIFLTLLLFNNEKIKFFDTIIIVLSLVFCKSASGIVLGLIIFFLYFFKTIKRKLKKSRKKGKILFIFLLSIIVITVIFVKSGGFIFFLSHIYDFENGRMSQAMMNRIGDLSICFKINNNIITALFGRGYIEIESDYTPGITRQIVYGGLVGTLIFYYCIIKQLHKVSTFVTILLFICILYNFFSSTMVGIGPLLWMPFCIVQEQQKVRISNNRLSKCEEEITFEKRNYTNIF